MQAWCLLFTFQHLALHRVLVIIKLFLSTVRMLLGQLLFLTTCPLGEVNVITNVISKDRETDVENSTSLFKDPKVILTFQLFS